MEKIKPFRSELLKEDISLKTIDSRSLLNGAEDAASFLRTGEQKVRDKKTLFRR